MAIEVIKTIKGRQYRYLQSSYRSGGKVRTKSVYLGPVGGKKRNRGGGFVNPLGIALSAVALGLHIAKHGTKSPKYKERDRPPDPRSWEAELAKERKRWEERIAGKRGAGKAKGTPDPKWQAFMDGVTARQTAQNAPGRTQGPAAKNFTVDDEIEARAAKFEAAVDEYNAGTTAAPDDSPSEP